MGVPPTEDAVESFLRTWASEAPVEQGLLEGTTRASGFWELLRPMEKVSPSLGGPNYLWVTQVGSRPVLWPWACCLY